MKGVIDEINSSGADILFVALGSPKQEMWIKQYLTPIKCKGLPGDRGDTGRYYGANQKGAGLVSKTAA